MSWFKSYDKEYEELFSHLTERWEMKPYYATAFLDAYKRSIGKVLFSGKKRISQLHESADPSVRLFAFTDMDSHDLALVGQAYTAYMADLRRGKHVGTDVEKAIWAILANRSDLISDADRLFSEYINETHEERFPRLFNEVFVD